MMRAGLASGTAPTARLAPRGSPWRLLGLSVLTGAAWLEGGCEDSARVCSHDSDLDFRGS